MNTLSAMVAVGGLALIVYLWGDLMAKRRSKTKFTQIHVSIPVHVLAEFDHTLGFNDSRSKKISKLMLDYARNEGNPLEDYSRKEILEHLQYKYDKDSPEDVLIQALLALH